MCDEWMPTIKLALTPEQFRQLPRNPAYHYEYLDGHAHLIPRGRHYHAVLDLKPLAVEEPVAVAPIREVDVPELEQLFAAAFRSIQPFGSLDDGTRLEAARRALGRTRQGGDGPWIEAASFLARDGAAAVGAVWVTLLPDGDPTDWDSYYWRELPPADCITRRLGRPHLTWIFVAPHLAGRGWGTALLAAAVQALLDLGFTQLASTFMAGNDSSILWHWRNGFQLLAHPNSYRLMQRRWRRGRV
jgi:GNAT superfamily N-acetyltransferase